MTNLLADGFRKRTGIVLVAAAALLWGTGGVVAKMLFGMTEITPLTVGFFRLALSVPALVLVGWVLFGRDILRTDGVRSGLVAVSVAMASYQVFYYEAVHRAGVAVATLVTLCLAPVLVALLSALWLREPFTANVARALALALAGTAMLVGFPAGDGATSLSGIAMAVGAAASYAALTVAGRSIAGHCHPARTIIVGFGGGALLLLPFALAQGLGLAYPAPAWSLLLYLGLVPTALAYVLFFTGMRTTPATVASILSLMEPLTATVLAWAVFGERLGLLGLAGGALLLGALLILVGGAKRSAAA
ncbi:DMT family transporter [Azospirillum sp. RWY-5-1]|uniref:DMT family transporter n=1 Tax=Azospirillum oleiclasticum TaxID=2735135 RepID=A0ABX2TA88_9PROT|nr:DMT family transporter [Azospirillum oleiclasticum]NYZ13565.1 DMT family transporter [Azospirillum oleiclasticum]NYZ20725.1 DMT family transporter [Azospirillum oleiclasticum]